VRDPAGKITTFNVPGGLNGTVVLLVKHGFVRDRDGTFTTFDAPGAAYGTIASRCSCCPLAIKKPTGVVALVNGAVWEGVYKILN
jgi:hypothetical protein